tara:strand:- start:4248 stop:4439 length:192 start_codon:yes stop_codon:yes gene_type:complete
METPMDRYWARHHLVASVNKGNRDWDRAETPRHTSQRLRYDEIIRNNGLLAQLQVAARHMDGI